MPQLKLIPVKELSLDLNNFRTIPQPNGIKAIEAMISTSPDRFWGLMDSLLDTGYLLTDNLIILKSQPESDKLIVKEGNRRVAALKIILKQVNIDAIAMPGSISKKLGNLSATWKKDNATVNCAVYGIADAQIVDRIVALAHGKGEKASRDIWNAVARARHAKAISPNSQPDLDLLDKYLAKGQNLTPSQKERWAGDYPLSVLLEMMGKFAARFGANSRAELAKIYPDIEHRGVLEDVVHDIGLKTVRFKEIRDPNDDLLAAYGLTPAPSNTQPTPPGNPVPGSPSNGNGPGVPPPGTGASGSGSGTGKPPATATNDPKIVAEILKKFVPVGNNRGKVVALLQEARKLKVDEAPLAFCFILRSMFELSAKAYCDDYPTDTTLVYKKVGGEDRHLADVLLDVANHLTKHNTDKAVVKILHGAAVELKKPDTVLSITSMNNLVHNPNYLVSPSDVSLMFTNVFPLLEAMNQ